jgi:hypothetical protein
MSFNLLLEAVFSSNGRKSRSGSALCAFAV